MGLNSRYMYGRKPRVEKIEEAKKLRANGADMNTLAEHFGMQKRSIRRWLQFPEKRLNEWKKHLSKDRA